MKKGLSLFALVVFLGALSVSPTFAQDAPRAPRKLQITAADRAAAAAVSVVHRHSLTTKTEAGVLLKHREFAASSARLAGFSRAFSEGSRVEGNDQLRFPGDVTNFLGGSTVAFAESHPIFLTSPDGTTCPANTCWGDPNTFLNAFGRSGLSHVTDQYVGESAHDRYTLGDQFVLSFTPSSTPLIDADIQALVHAAALGGEAGLGHVFHVFLPPGQDECMDPQLTFCYSPDNPSTFAFCAYHSAALFTSDVGLVLYTVEPFQNVAACQVPTGTPNGQLIDSTNSTLSHELMETITDPEGDAWRNFTDAPLFLAEIGDECVIEALVPVAPGIFAVIKDVETFRVGHQVFATQPEYSNEDHACAIRP